MSCSTELSNDDKAVGFGLDELEPGGDRGVVRMLGDSDRVLKLIGPNGAVQYVHQRFGNWGSDPDGTAPQWHSAFREELSDPLEAVRQGWLRINQEATVSIIRRTPPNSP